MLFRTIFFSSLFFNVEEIRDVLGREKKYFPLRINFWGGGKIIGISSIPRLIGWNVDDRLALYALYTREKEFYRLEERSGYLFTHR